MSSLDGAIDEPAHSLDTFPKTEHVKDEDFKSEDAKEDVELNTDADMNEQPASEDDEPIQDDGMDLFGEDEVADEVKHEDAAASPVSSEHLDGISSPERRHREAMEYAEEDEPEQTMEESKLEAHANIPNIPVPRSSDGNHWVIRIPNFIKVDSKPFHPDTYIGPEQEDEDTQTGESLREKSMSIKLKVENTVRWRWAKEENGQERRQSNSRVIRWSDGSLSLQLGKELFDISRSTDQSGSIPRQSMGGSQPSQSNPATLAKPQGLTYLVAQHKRAEILQCEAVISGHMSIRPIGMQSETHKMLVKAVGQKHVKVARLRMAPDPATDPEREVMELMKQASKKQSRRTRGEDDGLGAGRNKRRSSYAGRKRSGDDMWSDDEEEDVFGGASDDEYGAVAGGKRRKSDEGRDKKRGPGEYQNDDFVVADSDEEDGDYGDSDAEHRRRKKSRKHEEEAEDDLDRLDAKIEAEERKRRQETDAKGADKDGSAAEDAMDVESEDDDEWGVRRAGAGSRRKRAIDFDEEEEE